MTVNKLLEIASAEIGTTEWPKKSNTVKYNTWYYAKIVSGSAYPWCMAFVQWCFNEAGSPLPLRTASCSSLLNWYKKNKPKQVFKTPKPGDIVIYNFGHTGIVKSTSAAYIQAIEGNTSATDAGSQSNGGGVFLKKRKKTLVTAYIRPDYETKSETLSETKQEPTTESRTSEEEDMTKDQILEKIGDKYIETINDLPPTFEWAKKDLRELLDDGTINGGTTADVNPDDINMFLSDIKTILVIKRLLDKSK